MADKGVDGGRGRRSGVVSKQRGNSAQRFYVVLALVVVAGALLIVRAARAPRVRANVTTAPITPAQAEGYLLGNANAPVQIMEFADFECPACGNFAVITEPDVRDAHREHGARELSLLRLPAAHAQEHDVRIERRRVRRGPGEVLGDAR